MYFCKCGYLNFLVNLAYPQEPKSHVVWFISYGNIQNDVTSYSLLKM